MADKVRHRAHLLTSEQNAQVESVYAWKEPTDITDDEYKELAQMFSKPSRFALLRKVLHLYTTDELGITKERVTALVSGKDFATIGIEYAKQYLAEDSVRAALACLYADLKERMQDALEDGFVKANKDADEKRTEADVHSRDVGQRV